MFEYRPEYRFQSVQAFILALAYAAIDLLLYAYAEMRFRGSLQVNGPDRVAIFQVLAVALKIVLTCKYQGINDGVRPWTRLLRVCGGAVYGGFHFVVAQNIFDRNLLGQGVARSLVNCLYLGQQCLSVTVLVFGFSLRRAAAGLWGAGPSPLRRLMLWQCLQSALAFALALAAARGEPAALSAATARANAALHAAGLLLQLARAR